MTMLLNGDDTRLAKRLKEAITASGATHYAIGKQAGIKPDLLDRFMRGERDLRLASAGKIANALGLDLVSSAKPAKVAKTSKRTGAKWVEIVDGEAIEVGDVSSNDAEFIESFKRRKKAKQPR